MRGNRALLWVPEKGSQANTCGKGGRVKWNKKPSSSSLGLSSLLFVYLFAVDNPLCLPCLNTSQQGQRPTGALFDKYLPFYLKDNPELVCTKGSVADLGRCLCQCLALLQLMVPNTAPKFSLHELIHSLWSSLGESRF